MHDSNPLLSEFELPLLRRFFRGRHWGAGLALVFLLGGGAVLTLGHLAGANAFNRQILPEIRLSDGYQSLAPVNLVGGYLAQANHGLFYLLVAPAFAMAAARFLNSAHESFHKLVLQGRLPAAALVWVRANNRRFFCHGWWALLVSLVGWGLYHELDSIAEVRAGRSLLMGYVQAPLLDRWEAKFLKSNRWKMLSEHEESEGLTREIRRCLEVAAPATIELWVANGSVTFGHLKETRAQLWSGLVAKGDFDLRLESAVLGDRPLLRLNVKLSPYPRGRQIPWHTAFVIAVQILEGTFHALVAWVALKAIFWVIRIWRLLPGRDGWQARLVCWALTSYDTEARLDPLLTDPRKHFGLSDLHVAYNALILVLAMSAFSLPLVIISGIPKVPPGDRTAAAHAFQAPLLIALAAGLPVLVLAAGPMLLLTRRLDAVRERRLAQLDAKLGASQRDDEHEAALEKQRELIMAQTCWPHDDSMFKFLAVATVIFGVLPLCLHSGYAPRQVEEYLSFVRFCNRAARATTENLYHVSDLSTR